MRQYSKYFLPAVGIMTIVTSLIVFPFRHKLKNRLQYHIRVEGACIGCKDLFSDNVELHEQAYATEGIAPQAHQVALQSLFLQGVLVELKTNKYYTVRKLHYSEPLLLPKALLLINDLSESYSVKCEEASLSYIPFTISSVTRTTESVVALRKNNDNSIENSAHLKGKTFDISYTAFKGNKQQAKLFITSLNQLRKEGKCFVKFERNGTLHITAI